MCILVFDLGKVIEICSRAIDDSIYTCNYQYNLDNNIIKSSNFHQFKVAHFSFHIGEILGLSTENQRDIFILGLMHDAGFISSEIIPYESFNNHIINHEQMLDHCFLGELLIRDISFNQDVTNIIMFHHEKYNGTGFFGLIGEEIPLFSRILTISDRLDLVFNLENISDKKEEIKNYLIQNSSIIFDPFLVKIVIDILDQPNGDIDYSKRCPKIPSFDLDYSFENITSVTETFMKIIDHKSHFTYNHSSTVTTNIKELAMLCHFDEEKCRRLHIAANLHDIGKIYISKGILEKPLSLKPEEFKEIKKHPKMAEDLLLSLNNLEDIARWVGQHHEKLNGSGYPRGLKGEEIDFESQMLTVVDIYSALIESRPYRKNLELIKVKETMREMVKKGEINEDLVNKLFNIVDKKIKFFK